MLKHTVCFTGVSRKEHHLRSEGKGIISIRYLPCAFQADSHFILTSLLYRFYRQEQWSCQGLVVRVGWIWTLFISVFVFPHASCGSCSTGPGHVFYLFAASISVFRDTLGPGWRKSIPCCDNVIESSCEGLGQALWGPLTCPASFFSLVIHPSHWNLMLRKYRFTIKKWLKNTNWVYHRRQNDLEASKY